MKKYLLLVVLLVSFTQQAFAFNVRAFVQFNRLHAQARVFNNFNRPIICDIRATGVTYYGQYLYAYADRVIIYPGMTGYAYVYSNPGNPFVNAFANAQCYWY